MLRHFLYLDSDLTSEFLAQAEGGIYDEESIRVSRQRGRKAGGKVGAGPVAAELGGGKSAEDEAARTVRQTPESSFDRLVTKLNDAGDVVLLESDKLAIEARRGQIVEADVSLAMPAFISMVLNAVNFAPAMQLLQNAGVVPAMEESAMAGVVGAIAFAQLIQTLPMVGTLVGGSYKLVMQLKPDHTRAAAADLQGEATVLAKIRRHMSTTERQNIVGVML